MAPNSGISISSTRIIAARSTTIVAARDCRSCRMQQRGNVQQAARELSERWPDPDIKLWITSNCLAARRDSADLFAFGEYIPLTVGGESADHVICFRTSLRTRSRNRVCAAALLSTARS